VAAKAFISSSSITSFSIIIIVIAIDNVNSRQAATSRARRVSWNRLDLKSNNGNDNNDNDDNNVNYNDKNDNDYNDNNDNDKKW